MSTSFQQTSKRSNLITSAMFLNFTRRKWFILTNFQRVNQCASVAFRFKKTSGPFD
ncbi:MAG: hypothetical protein ACTS6G_03360 [Candidatus Hodgkinia cicadicola]